LNQGALFSLFFGLVYCYIALAHRHRGVVVWIGAALAVLVSTRLGHSVNISELMAGINWNVLLIFGGILFIAEVMIDVGIPANLAGRIINGSRNYGWAAVLICALASVLSIFVENVATVMIVAPIAFEVCKKHGANPVPLLVGIAISSNLQGTATLVGDPPSMILAASENMGFNDFFFMLGKPGIFFAVQAGALASFGILWKHLGRNRDAVPRVRVTPVVSWIPVYILATVIAGLAVLSLYESGVGAAAGLLCALGGALSVAWYGIYRRGRSTPGAMERTPWKLVKAFDLDTLFLLGGIFFMGAALDEYGVMDATGAYLAGVAGESPVMAYLMIVAGSMLISAFVDNVPFVTAMIPVTRALAMNMAGSGGSHHYLVFGLLIGSCLGGNISPVGASANIVAVSLLRKQGHKVSFWDFTRIGLPFTLAATAAGALFIWMFWHP